MWQFPPPSPFSNPGYGPVFNAYLEPNVTKYIIYFITRTRALGGIKLKGGLRFFVLIYCASMCADSIFSSAIEDSQRSFSNTDSSVCRLSVCRQLFFQIPTPPGVLITASYNFANTFKLLTYMRY